MSALPATDRLAAAPTTGVELMEAIRDGSAGPARLDGELVHLGRPLAHGEVTLRDGDDQVLVRAAGTCRVLQAG